MDFYNIPAAPTPVRGGRTISMVKLMRGLKLAVRSLWLHKLRALLSVLGIVIGTSAVIALMAFGEGSMQDALADIKRQGATNIIVRSVKPPDDSASSSRSFVASYGLKFRDLERFETFYGAINLLVPMRVFPSETRYLERTYNARMVATTTEYAAVNKLVMARGRFLSDEDDAKSQNVCVLGSTTADRLFPFEDPIGHTVQIRNHRYFIVGVVDNRMPTGGTGGSQAAEDFNHDIYVPFSTVRGRVGNVVFTRSTGGRNAEQVDISQVVMTVEAEVDTAEGRAKVKAVGDELRRMMEKYHDKRDWAITVPLDRLEEAERQQERFTSLLVLIASISLVVGGIGIMNIMLATVTERTREIGIRRALGAKQKDITIQFLIEATVQTAIGGLLGVVFGLSIVLLVPVAPNIFSWFAHHVGFSDISMWLASFRIPAKVHVPAIFLALGVSVMVGILFGWYPAQRAAKLDPIEALRHD